MSRSAGRADGGVRDSPGRLRHQLGADSGVYRLEIRFTESSSPGDRATVVDELAEYLLVLSDHDDRPYLIERTISLTIATRHDVAVVRAALEDLPVVDRVTPTSGDRAGVTLPASNREASAAFDGATSARETFGEVERRTDAVDAHELLDDPEYAQFLDDFDELSCAEDEVSLAELLAENTTDRPAAADRPPGATEPDAGRENVAERLLEELERGQLSDDEHERLRDHLVDEPAPSLEARVTHLQSRFHELSAYIDAMAAFIDENGDAETLLADVQAELEGVRDDVEELRRVQTAHADRFGELADSLETIEGRQLAVESTLETFDDRWDRLSTLLGADDRD